MNANIMKRQYMTGNVTFMVWRSFVIFFTLLRPSDLIVTLTYVLMDNICPCLYKSKTCVHEGHGKVHS